MKDYIIKKNGIITEIALEKDCKITIYEIYPGILFAFNDVYTHNLPILTQQMESPVFTINFATHGICGLYSTGGKYIYLRAGELMISNEQAAHAFEYPAGQYNGIEIYIMKEAFTHTENLEFFQIYLDQIQYAYLEAPYQTIIAEDISLIKNSLTDITMLRNKQILDINLLRLHTFYILRILTTGIIASHSGYEGALLKSQVDIAKKAEMRLTSDLSKRTTIATIACDLGISATSLKNYFKAVFGQNISEYLKEQRIQKAKQQLRESTDSILDIANQVGFESQSKFTQMFHETCGITPTEYRRQSDR